MAKAVQIRRGTTAQNDNFTGLTGEITFDTDAKTLRVHDGVKLGGYTLARADDNTSGNTGGDGFDINSVSDDFWGMLFARFSPETFTIQTGKQIPVRESGNIEYIFESDKPIKFARVMLTCVTAEAGYSVGEIVWDCGIGERYTPTPNVWIDSSGVHARLIIGDNNKWWVAHRTTGARTEITPNKWTLSFTVWC